MKLRVYLRPMRLANLVPAFAIIVAFILITPKIYARMTHPGTRVVAVDCSSVVNNTEYKDDISSKTTADFAYPTATSNRRFVDQNGDVYLLKMMSSWAMAQRCSKSAITSALEGLKKLGFNAVTVSPFGVHLNDSFGDRYRNESGQRFFVGAPFASPFGPAWSSMDWIVQEATRLHMTVVLSQFLSWGDTGTVQDLISAGLLNNYKYGKTLAERYARYPNIVWHVMGDFKWSPNDPIGLQIDAVFHGIKDGEGSRHRLIIAETLNGLTSYDQFISAERGVHGYQWFIQSANTLYGYQGNSTELFDLVYGEFGAESYGVIDIEPPYVSSPHYRGNRDQQYRERNYSVFLRGGMGINYGHEKWWPFGAVGIFDGGAGWFEALSDRPMIHAKYAWNLIGKYVVDPTWKRDDGRFVTAGIGAGEIKAASGYSEGAAVAYFPTRRSVTVDTTAIAGSGRVKLTWYDPTTGTYTMISESEDATASRSISFLGNHPDGSSDWVLVAERL